MKNLTRLIGIFLITVSVSFTNVDKKIVVIDVGHGGQDNGAVVEGINEKEVTLNIALKIKELNQNPNLEIILTRDSDKFLSLSERAAFINDLNPDQVITLHVNAHNDVNKSGTEIFTSKLNIEKTKSDELALNLESAFKNRNPIVKNANFLLLKNIDHPIAMIEIGFLTNEKDRTLLTSEEGQSKLAILILEGIK